MQVCAIVCEYNPLHSGHAHQIERVKAMGYRVLCIQSASFVQRGEPAIYDKFTRASWALKAGADLVVELPCLFSLRSAEGFAQGAMHIAHHMGADAFCFGSELADLGALRSIAQLHRNETDAFRQALREKLDEGLPYPAAREAATRHCLTLPDAAFGPNSTLGIEYIKAAEALGGRLQPLAIARKGAVNSSACRSAILSGQTPGLPDFVHQDASQLRPVTLASLEQALLARLRSMDSEQYSQLPDLSEGLENRIQKAAVQAADIQTLLEAIAVKRYPLARIKRILCCALLGISQAHDALTPTYARVLGIRRDASDTLKHLTQISQMPIVTKSVELKDEPLFRIEQRATDIRALAEAQPARLDFTHPLVTL